MSKLFSGFTLGTSNYDWSAVFHGAVFILIWLGGDSAIARLPESWHGAFKLLSVAAEAYTLFGVAQAKPIIKVIEE